MGVLHYLLDQASANAENTRPNIPIQVLPNFSGLEPIHRLPIGDRFTFEDACRTVRSISFRDIPNWEVSGTEQDG
jgi:hypothetical protein